MVRLSSTVPVHGSLLPAGCVQLPERTPAACVIVSFRVSDILFAGLRTVLTHVPFKLLTLTIAVFEDVRLSLSVTVSSTENVYAERCVCKTCRNPSA